MIQDLSDVTLYMADSHPCSYLVNQKASTVFVDPKLVLTKEQYSHFSNLGFRRSGHYIYQPHCANCHACVPVRIAVTKFVFSRQQKRVIRNNQDLVVQKVAPRDTEEYFDLYKRYINTRHSDGDMYPATREQYQSFLVDVPEYCAFYEFRKDSRLMAVAVVDVLENHLSAVYTFFEPDEKKRSLGQYAILWQIKECQRLGLDYLSLGYWIKTCRKMSYKLQYRPIELFVNQRWVQMN